MSRRGPSAPGRSRVVDRGLDELCGSHKIVIGRVLDPQPHSDQRRTDLDRRALVPLAAMMACQPRSWSRMAHTTEESRHSCLARGGPGRGVGVPTGGARAGRGDLPRSPPTMVVRPHGEQQRLGSHQLDLPLDGDDRLLAFLGDGPRDQVHPSAEKLSRLAYSQDKPIRERSSRWTLLLAVPKTGKSTLVACTPQNSSCDCPQGVAPLAGPFSGGPRCARSHSHQRGT